MNFAAFQLWREQCLRTNPAALDCAETNLYRTLAPLQPRPNKPDSNHQVFRCDLARAWLNRYGFPESLSRLALVCRGVRHALSLIFSEVGRSNACLWIPSDVYPVYLELAAAAGIEPRMFQTLPRPKLPSSPNLGSIEYLVLANPWKPLGRFLSDEESSGLVDWLGASPNRWLLMDCVYDLGRPFHITTRKLMETGRSILLHSVTKGWLWPKTFGVALIPESHPELESAFRNQSPSPEQLRLAEQLLSCDADLPGRVTDALGHRRQKLLAALPKSVVDSFLPDCAASMPGCYLFPVGIPAEHLLRQHGIVGIPASAFGADWEGCILSSLGGHCGEI